MKFKTFFILVCIMSIMSVLSFNVSAASSTRFDIPISVAVNDKFIKMDSKPFLSSGTTYVPVRFVAEALGAGEITWQNNTAIIKKDSTTIELPAWQNYAYVNGKYTNISGGVKLINGRTYAPIRFIAETFGATVNWDSSTYTVKIYMANAEVPAFLVTNRGYGDDEIYWLARIIYAESVGEPMAGKIGVGNVVLNRVKSPDFPDTIYGVIFDKKYGVQFTPVADGRIYNTPDNESIIAAKRALEGENTVKNSLYFLNPAKAPNSWIIRTRAYVTTIGNHRFYS